MRTSKPFSTISYNTESFLIRKLTQLQRSHMLDFWAFVKHLPEDDERKSHIHLICIPSKIVDTSSFLEYFVEANLTTPGALPLRCLPCMSSKFSDWYLYCSHDPDYLATKMLSRKFRYTDSDFVTSDPDYFFELIKTSDCTFHLRFAKFRDLVLGGAKFHHLIAQGFVPLPLINQYYKAYEALVSVACERGSSYAPDGEVRPDVVLTDDRLAFK